MLHTSYQVTTKASCVCGKKRKSVCFNALIWWIKLGVLFFGNNKVYFHLENKKLHNIYSVFVLKIVWEQNRKVPTSFSKEWKRAIKNIHHWNLSFYEFLVSTCLINGLYEWLNSYICVEELIQFWHRIYSDNFHLPIVIPSFINCRLQKWFDSSLFL